MADRNRSRTSAPLLVEAVAALRAQVAQARNAGRRIGFVPTMGALHAGHISLIDAAVANGNYTVVSIYVNPAQFGPGEDLSNYPRRLEADIQACRTAGADLIFAPSNAEVFPPGDQTRVRPGPLAIPLCGPFRPGHFEGVCTVVAKLFNMVQPDIAYFGQKDAQQALVIRRMVEDLRVPVAIDVRPIVREADGLAMSSRNAYLTPEERCRALCLHAALVAGRDRLLAGDSDLVRVGETMRRTATEIGSTPETGIEIDYLTVVDARTLETPTSPAGRLLLAGAVHIGRTRLIDNIVVDLPADTQ